MSIRTVARVTRPVAHLSPGCRPLCYRGTGHPCPSWKNDQASQSLPKLRGAWRTPRARLLSVLNNQKRIKGHRDNKHISRENSHESEHSKSHNEATVSVRTYDPNVALALSMREEPLHNRQKRKSCG